MSDSSKYEKAVPAADDRVKRLQNLKPGDEVICRQVGYGLVSYERSGPVVEIRDGKLFTETFDKIGLEWIGNNWVLDAGLGLELTFVFREEVPAGKEIGCDEDYTNLNNQFLVLTSSPPCVLQGGLNIFIYLEKFQHRPRQPAVKIEVELFSKFLKPSIRMEGFRYDSSEDF